MIMIMNITIIITIILYYIFIYIYLGDTFLGNVFFLFGPKSPSCLAIKGNVLPSWNNCTAPATQPTSSCSCFAIHGAKF